MSCNIVGNQPSLPRNPWIHVCDDPRNGGITGNIGQNIPKPWVLEERPTMTNPITGERVYIDEFMKNRPEICYMA
jgi:hypothetical protein